MFQYERNEGLELISYILDSINKSALYKQDVSGCFSKIKNFSRELYLHSVNVSFLSMLLGINSYEGKKEQEELFIAALLHDYGKLFISKSILEKTGGLTLEERKIVELHSKTGYLYLKQDTRFPERILNGVLDHHERVDGNGYGQRKKGEDISDYAKIIMIADVYDAMVSDRVYRRKIDRKVVNEYLYKNAGRYFDYNLTIRFITQTSNMDLDFLEPEFQRRLKMSQNLTVRKS